MPVSEDGSRAGPVLPTGTADRTTLGGSVPAGNVPRHRGLVLAAASLGFAVIQLDVSVVNVAFKVIGAELGGGVAGLQWVVDAYTVAFAALILTAGALGDRLGAKRIFLVSSVLFTVASAACGLAPNLGLLIAARAVQGTGAAGLGACSLVLLNHAYPQPAERARAVGIWAAGASAALAAGPLAGGLLIATLGWRWIFFINLPLGATGIWLTIRFATETPRARDRGLDLRGQLAAVLTLGAFAAAIIEAGSLGLTDPVVLAGLAVAALAGTGFVLTEARRTRPMLPLALFRSRAFSGAVATGLLINIAFYGLIFVFSLFFQRRLGLSPLGTGLAFVPVMAAIMAANILARRVTAMLGTRMVIALGAAFMAAACLGMLGFTSARSGQPLAAGELIALLAAAGLGVGLIVPAMTSTLLGSVDRSWSGIASGTLTALRQTGSVLGVALFGSLLASLGLIAGLRIALAVSAALALAVAALSTLAG